jgi:hypothetical protein
MNLKPSAFISAPMGSVLQKSEAETIAANIMAIRVRLGDRWPLTWLDYKRERQKDGEFTMTEKGYFEEVYPLIEDQIGAISFAPAWARDARKAAAAQKAAEPTDIRMAQVTAGENAVIAKLRRQGLA